MVSDSNTALGNYFDAKSYAIIGASTKPGSAGYVLSVQMLSSFKGDVYAVNPRGGEILGRPLLKSISEMPDNVDVAVLVTAAKYVPDSVRQCLDKGVRNFVVISGGFAEIDEEGAKMQQQIVDMCREHGARVIGPNCVGLFAPKEGIDTVFLPIDKLKRPGAGEISLFSQSGALVAAIMNELIKGNMENSVSKILSFGNASDITELDALDYLEHDEQTKIIWSYLEGFKYGDAYLRKLRKISKTKPVITIKSNRTDAGAHASASHSASLAANDAVTDQLLAQAGCIRAKKWTDLFDCGRAFVNQPLPKGRRVGVVTDAGGSGVMLCDCLDDNGLQLAQLSEESRKTFRATFPPYYPCENPLDLTGSAGVEDYVKAINIALQDDNTDAIVVIILTCVPNLPADELVSKLAGNFGNNNKPDKPMLIVVAGGTEDAEIKAGLTNAGLPVYDTEERAAVTLATMVKYNEFLQRNASLKELPALNSSSKMPEIDAIIEGAKKDGRKVLLEPEAAEIFRLKGIPTPTQSFVKSVDEAVSAYKNTFGGEKIVMKLVSPQVIHKSDENAVAVGLKSEEEVRAVAEDYFARFADRDVRGILMYSMVPKGTEIIAGVVDDPTFGSLVLCGIGGVLVEILNDVAFSLCPTHPEDAKQMIGNLKSQNILDGYRGAPAVDREALADIVTKVSQLADAYRGVIGEIDVNPLISYQEGDSTKICAVDARIILTQ
ncbi:hypothetical protein P9112_013066 [Eukaryota sp. TZLM1-RC]